MSKTINFEKTELNDLFHVLREVLDRIDNTDWSKEDPAKKKREMDNADRYGKLLEKVRP